ncbi:class A beta-lactamase [Streptomyces roseirectus]|uniref:Beta-lactamase n=1 Tax=Streptomyces roseirectus TaxID=2768066 RepID=A0A7H0IRJ8_9ACTN|nr:class A beta-lactamase [Streptomyces roseirectus]QNP75414.1 class A beta-lactamase [Streptomyces roseirectus]
MARPNTNSLKRRTLLTSAAAAALTAGVASSAHAAGTPGASGAFRALEDEYAARLGVFAHDTATGRTLTYRADELFPICSVFKTLAAGAVLREGVDLDRRIHYTLDDVTASGYGPVTAEHVATGMTVSELCAATVSHSDNAAGNLLLRELGGPTSITRFARTLGDPVTRLDRWEPDLNSAEPWRETDTTSPRAIARTYARLILGTALPSGARTLLTSWLVANTTNTARFRAGLPADWTLADKTGGGTAYGVANDVGVVWPPGRPPLVIAVLSTKHAAEGPREDAVVARAAKAVADELG